MPNRARLIRYAHVLSIFPVVSATAATGTLSAIYSFSGADGSTPVGGLIAAANGGLYGTTAGGGTGFGTVFQLVRQPQTGNWTQTFLHTFSGPDGENPAARLTGLNGALLGTTPNGGAKGFGTIFELIPGTSGAPWTEATIYSFQGGVDGRAPFGNLIADARGDLYGTTTYGGTVACTAGQGCGTVFELSPPAMAGDAWTETILYRFQAGIDGTNPVAGLVFGRDGSLYGVAPAGGSSGDGAVFRVVPPVSTGAPWTESVIYNFLNRTDGEQPEGGLALGPAGNFYGTTAGGGTAGCGTVFVLSPPATPGAIWIKTTIHEFLCSDGAYPEGALLVEPRLVYWTTSGGGASGGGTVFMLAAPSVPGDLWTETVLGNFQSASSGFNAEGSLVMLPNGSLFGTAMSGGSGGDGTVFRLIP